MTRKNHSKMSRRDFFEKSSIGLVGAGLIGVNTGNSTPNTEKEANKIQEYRTLGRTGFKVSDISCGGVLLDYEALLKAVLKSGVNYIDTAPFYGNSEKIIGNTMKEFDRKSIFITTKFGGGRGELTKEKVLAGVRKSLEKLQVDYIDCLLFGGLQTSERVKNEAFHAAVSQLKNEGRLRFCGIASHGSIGWSQEIKETMEDIHLAAVEDGRFDVLLLVYNFLHKGMGERIIKAAKEKNIGTVIMKSDPVSRYYRIKDQLENMEKNNKKIPQPLLRTQEKYKKYVEQASSFKKEHNLTNDQEVRDAAIKFILDNKKVDTVLISFSNYDDIETYVNLSGQSLTSSSKKSLKSYEKSFGYLYCRHGCGVCESQCPLQIPVNTIMRYNHYFNAQKREKYAMKEYAGLSSQNADICKTCKGYCESACPFNVPIQSLLSVAHNNLTVS